MFACPSCKEEFDIEWESTHNVMSKSFFFCPFCGAEMEGEADAISYSEPTCGGMSKSYREYQIRRGYLEP